jgi:hypothetical protein
MNHKHLENMKDETTSHSCFTTFTKIRKHETSQSTLTTFIKIRKHEHHR